MKKNLLMFFTVILLACSMNDAYASSFYNPNANYDPLNSQSQAMQCQQSQVTQPNQYQARQEPQYIIQQVSGRFQNPQGYEKLVNAFLDAVPNADYKIKVLVQSQQSTPLTQQYQNYQQTNPYNNSQYQQQSNSTNTQTQQSISPINTLNTINNLLNTFQRGY